MDAGLFSLQLCDLVLGLLATGGDADLKESVEVLLNQRDYSTDDVKRALSEYAAHVDDGAQRTLVEKIASLL